MAKILLIRLSALGDVIFSLPTLEALKRQDPQGSVDWVVEDKAASLLLHRGDLNRVIVYPRKKINASIGHVSCWPALATLLFGHLRELRRDRYDRVYDLQGNLKSGFHTLLSRGSRKIGFHRTAAKEGNHLFTKERVQPPPNAVHRIEKSFSLIKPDFTQTDILRPRLHLAEDLLAEARAALSGMDFPPGRMMVVHPGTSAFGAYKRWAPEKFGEMARRLHKDRGFRTLVTWGPDERDLAEDVVQAAGEEAAVPAPPMRSLLHLAAFIRMSDLYVSADSGPLHLANYLGVPCLALFGPKDPALYRPYFPPSRVARAGVDCSPCTRRTCDDPICMKRLEVDFVYDELCELLADANRTV
ncbi:MAG: glycosyltransferase family 9 protein [Planctomycetes bacterium]|nr:glycosyltransferase family 9 protein [Planctomycetota bacterium]